MSARTDADDPRALRAQDFPRAGNERDRLEFLLRYAILAPSTHNTQPWRFSVAPGRVLLYRDRSRWLEVADPAQRELHLSVGCALENLLVAARAFGYQPAVSYFPRELGDDCVAALDLPPLNRPGTPKHGLLDAVARRITSRKPFLPRAIPGAELARLQAISGDRAVLFHVSDDARLREQLEALVAEADARLFADPAYREELVRWVGDGAFGTSWLLSKLGQVAVTYLNLGRATGRHDVELMHSAPAVGLLATLDDGRVSQVRSGQQYQRIGLQAELFGLAMQPMSQMCQVPHIRAQLGRHFAAPQVHVQMVFRLGFPGESEPVAPRRPLEEVLA